MGRHQALLQDVYDRLLTRFGPQRWWPADTPLEMAVGAMLTQNAAWGNVAQAIGNLKAAGLLDEPGAAERLFAQPADYLEHLIRPSGYFRVKARRLKGLLELIVTRFGGEVEAMGELGLIAAREALLAVKGVGPETADSILLYALDKPVFVVDAYTRRILCRHELVPEEAGYDEIQALFMDNLAADPALFNEYHALIVRLAKEHCRRRPACGGCPLENISE